MFFLLWIFFAAVVGAWARSWGYGFALWAGMALVISPLLAAIILLATGPETGKRTKPKDIYDREEPIRL